MADKVHEFTVKVKFNKECSREMAFYHARLVITGKCDLEVLNDTAPTTMKVQRVLQSRPSTKEGAR